jgi:predicted dehydrogenase
MDVGTYCVNALRFFGGEPVRARGEQVTGASGVDVVFAGVLAFENEVVGVFDCGFVYSRRAGLELVGSSGSIFVAQPFTIQEPAIELRRPHAESELITVERANSYHLELENVSGAIRGEVPLLLGREDAVGQARVLEALYRSAETDS